jgi:Na+-driven multidrug efflux pump
VILPSITLVSVLYYFGAQNLVRLFMDNEAIIAYGTRFMRGFCLGLPFLCIDFLAVGVFQALGMGRRALIFAIMRKIILEIPAIFVLNYFFPLYGLAYTQFTAEVVLAIAALVMLRRIFREDTSARS